MNLAFLERLLKNT